jgi:transmembrane sensor
MAASVSETMQIRACAAAWHARLQADDVSDAEQHAFREWLAADPAHAAAFELMTNVWSAAKRPIWQDVRNFSPSREGWISRRAVLAGSILTASAGTVFLLTQAAQAGVYKTDIGEQKHILLQDGTAIFLDTDTKVVTGFSSSARTVQLEYGRANFNIASDKTRPFKVAVAGNIIVGAGFTSDVRNDDGQVAVVLIQGRATVESSDSHGQLSRILVDGERLRLGSHHKAELDRPNLLPLLAWQTGQVIFQNEKLLQAVYEMNRYSSFKLRIADSRIENWGVSGVYRVGNSVLFAQALEKLLAVSLHRFDDHIDIVGDDNRMRQI